MDGFKINTIAARDVSDRIPHTARRVAEINDDIQRVRTSADPRILGRANLMARLMSVQNSLKTLEGELMFMHNILTQNINEYEETERRLMAEVNTIQERITTHEI